MGNSDRRTQIKEVDGSRDIKGQSGGLTLKCPNSGWLEGESAIPASARGARGILRVQGSEVVAETSRGAFKARATPTTRRIEKCLAQGIAYSVKLEERGGGTSIHFKEA
jgi:hypothetical protein